MTDPEHEAHETLVDGQSLGGAVAPRASAGLPAAIGPYRVLSRLGEGGFGVVYLAEQLLPIRRRVALKVIKPGMDSAAVLARFDAERQALAVMDHPWVARVFDGGCTADGRPYFAMEHVDGESITRYCEQHRLGPRQRIALFARVCTAVQHAHAKGVIHRDIKPSNILVQRGDGATGPQPKVIDFGVAKALAQPFGDGSLQTEAGQLVGTPEYMSPEQAGDGTDIDIRADIYSLGAVLYELLCGEPPHTSAQLRTLGLYGFQQLLREQDPPQPSRRRSPGADGSRSPWRRLARRPGDVDDESDWIVMKCLEKDRSARYETAAALADDLGRYLRNEPLQAGPPGARYRLRKFVRRHRKAVIGGAMTIMLLLAALVAVAVSLSEARRQEALAAQARQAADRRAAELEQVVRFQAERLSDIDPAEMGEVLRADLLARHAAAGTPVDAVASDAANAAFEQSLARINLTDVALHALDRSIFATALAAADAELPGQPRNHVRILQTIATALRQLGLRRQAADPQARALEIARRQFGATDPLTLETLAEAGLHAWRDGRLDDAGRLLAERLASARQGGDAVQIASALADYGFIRKQQGELAEAEVLLREAVDRHRAASGEHDPITLDAYGELGDVLDQLGRAAEAEQFYRASLDGWTALHGPDHLQTLFARYRLGQAFSSQGRSEEAGQLFAETLAGRRRLLGDDHPATLVALNNLGLSHLDLGRLEIARPLLLDALQRRRDTLGPTHPDTLASVNVVALLHMLEGDHPTAASMFREAFDGFAALRGEDDPMALRVANNIASLHRTGGRLDEAAHWFRRALDGRRRTLGHDHVDSIRSAGNLAAVLALQGRPHEAVPLIDDALRRARDTLPAPHWVHGVLAAEHGYVLTALGRHRDAEARLLEAHATLAASLDASEDRLQEVVRQLVDLYADWPADAATGDRSAEHRHWQRQLLSPAGAAR